MERFKAMRAGRELLELMVSSRDGNITSNIEVYLGRNNEMIYHVKHTLRHANSLCESHACKHISTLVSGVAVGWIEHNLCDR